MIRCLIFYYSMIEMLFVGGLFESIVHSPVLLISFNGLSSEKFEEFLKENPKSTFQKLISNGLKANYMIPSFPTQTYPNHWTLVTGLFPESHGIVGNSFYDPIYDEKVNLVGGDNRHKIQWWNKSEPIWFTAKKQGLKTAASLWPGSDVSGMNPDKFFKLDGNDQKLTRIKEFVEWLVNFDLDLGCIHFNHPDYDGHDFGPDSYEYMEMILILDQFLTFLIDLLEKEKLFNNVNLIIVSDHGMTQMRGDSLIQLSEHVNTSLIDLDRSILEVTSLIYPASEEVAYELYEQLFNISSIQVFFKDNIPDELNFKNNERIGPILAIAEEGYSLANDVNKTRLAGGHGYSQTMESMRSIFIAKGPSFQSNKTIDEFANVNVYALICELLKIKCNEHNGTAEIFKPFMISKNQSSNNNQSNINCLKLLILFLIMKLIR